MKKTVFIFASIIMCLLSSCSDYTATKTMHVSLSEPNQVSYTLSYNGDELNLTEQKQIKESMLSIAKRNLSADEAQKELQKIFTKNLKRSALSLSYVSRSEDYDGHSSFYVSHNWTLLLWCAYTIIAAILFCIAKNVIKHKLRNRRPQKLSNELDPGD